MSRQLEKIIGSIRSGIYNWYVAVAGVDSNGNPVLLPVGPSGALATEVAASSSTTAATMTQANKTVAATGTPEKMVATTTLVSSVDILASKDRTTANTGNVFVGFSATNDSQLRILTPGQSITFSAPAGKKIDLSAIYIDVATNGDGVIWTAVA